MVVWTPPWITKEPVVQPQPIKGGVVKWDEPVVNQKLLDKWRANELPPDLLQAANVPSYDDWKFKPYEPEPGWGVRPQGYMPQQPQREPSLWEKAKPYIPLIDPLGISKGIGVARGLQGAWEAYEKYVGEPVKQKVLERWPEPKPTPETPAYSGEAGLYGLPSAAKQERVRQAIAGEAGYLPLWVAPIGPGGKGAKAVKEALEQGTKWAVKRAAEGATKEEILHGLSLVKIPEAEATKIIERLTGKVAKAAPKIPEVAPKVGIPVVEKLKQLVSQFEKGTLLEMRAETEALRKPITKQRVAAATAAREVAGGGLEGFYAGLRELKGKKPIVEFEAIGKEFTPQEVKDLFNIAAEADTRYFTGLHIQEGLHKLLFEGVVPQPKELELLGRAFGNDLIGVIVKQIKGGKWDTFLDVAGLMRAFQTTADISYGMRQAFVMAVSHPIQSTKTFTKAVASWFKKSSAETLDRVVRENPLYDIATAPSLPTESRLFLPGVGGEGWQPLYLKEEAVQTRFLGKIGPWVERWAGKIPKVGKPIGKFLAAPLSILPRSERAFVFPLNKVRMDKFTNMYRDMERWLASQEIQKLEMAGKAVPRDFVAEVPLDVVAFINRYINVMTGRGNLGKALNSAAPVLNQILYSSRYQASVFETPYYWGKAIVTGGMPIKTKSDFIKAITTMSPIRKHAIRDIATVISFSSTMLSLAVWRASVDKNIKADFNPISTNFCRVGYKNTYLNILPMKPWIVFAARLITGLTKTSGGDVRKINRGELTEDFIRTKLSPQVGLITDLLYEATVVGEKMEGTAESIKTQIRNRLAPMTINDFIEAWMESGWIGVGMASFSIPGVSVISYPPYKPKTTPKKTTPKVTPSVPSPSKSTGGWKPPF